MRRESLQHGDQVVASIDVLISWQNASPITKLDWNARFASSSTSPSALKLNVSRFAPASLHCQRRLVYPGLFCLPFATRACGHSLRNATVGSTEAARRAGKYVA